jgi:hypothetical protein
MFASVWCCGEFVCSEFEMLYFPNYMGFHTVSSLFCWHHTDVAVTNALDLYIFERWPDRISSGLGIEFRLVPWNKAWPPPPPSKSILRRVHDYIRWHSAVYTIRIWNTVPEFLKIFLLVTISWICRAGYDPTLCWSTRAKNVWFRSVKLYAMRLDKEMDTRVL